MNTGAMDPAVVGGLTGAGMLLLGTLVFLCKQKVQLYMVKQHRKKRKPHVPRVLTDNPIVLVQRTQMRTVLQRSDKNGSARDLTVPTIVAPTTTR